MKKISLRLRISLLTGTLILISSFVTSFFAFDNYNKSTHDIRVIAVETSNSVQSESQSEASIKDKEEMSFAIGNDAMYDELKSLEDSRLEAISNIKQSNDDELVEYYTQLNDSLTSSDERFYKAQFLYSVGASIMGMIIAYFASKKLIKPITRLAQDVENIDEIEKAQPLAIYNPKDEIGVLTANFNKFIEKEKKYSKKQSSFVSNVAHELKTPLSVMKASLQLIDENSDFNEYQEVFAMQDRNINRLNNIINSLLVVKQENLEMGNKRIDEIILTVLNEQKKLIEDKEIKIHLDIKKIVLKTNEDLFYRLVSNLISNATKYNKTGGDIYIELNDKMMSIRDSGIGIEEKYLNDIFEPLFCIDKSRSGGSGLGLSIVKDICDSLGYTIDVNSKLNCGSEFVVTFNQIASVIEKEGVFNE